MAGLEGDAPPHPRTARVRNAQDSRAVDVVMTAAGEQLGTQICAVIRDEPAPMTGRFDTTERRTVARPLEHTLDF